MYTECHLWQSDANFFAQRFLIHLGDDRQNMQTDVNMHVHMYMDTHAHTWMHAQVCIHMYTASSFPQPN